MKPHSPHKHAEFIKAWADGIAVEFSNGDFNGWRDVTEKHHWKNETDYRIKPAAPKWPETTMSCDDMFKSYSEELLIRGHNSFGTDSNGLKAVCNAAIAHACETGQLVPKDKADALYHIYQGTVVPRDCYEIAMRDLEKAQRGLLCAGFVDHGAQEWKPPVNKAAVSLREAHAQIEARDEQIEALRNLNRNAANRLAELAADRAERDTAIAEAVRDALVSGVANYSAGCAHYINSSVDLAAIIAGVKP